MVEDEPRRIGELAATQAAASREGALSELRHEIRYVQLGDADTNGDITFNGQTRLASGRLDLVGSSVVAEGFVCGADDDLLAVVEVTRTAAATIDVLIRLTGRSASDPAGQRLVQEARLADVPLTTAPADFGRVVERLRTMGSTAQRGRTVRTMGWQPEPPPADPGDAGTGPA